MKRSLLSLVLLCLLLVTAACSSKSLQVSEVWARPGEAGGTSAVYFVVTNPSSQDDALLGAASQAAETVEMHMSMMQENETMTMMHQESIPVPAGDTVEFTPGGLHLMLIDLAEALEPGDIFQVTLDFQNSGKMSLDAEVKAP
jgi:copper(I)-binding protein